jgi:hypothetical protein
MASVLRWRPVSAWLAVPRTRTRLSFVFGRRAASDSVFGSPLMVKRAYAHHVDNSRIVGPGAFQQPLSIPETALGAADTTHDSSGPTSEDAFSCNDHNAIEHVHDVKQNPHLPNIDAYILSEFARLVSHSPVRVSDANSNETRTEKPLSTNGSVTVTDPSITRHRARARDAYESQERTDPGPCSQKTSNASSVVVPSLCHLLAEYDANAARILKRVLPGESVPLPERRLCFGDEHDCTNSPSTRALVGLGARDEQEDGPVVLVAHVAVNEKERAQKMAVCSGFFIDSRRSDSLAGDNSETEDSKPILVSCAHTLEEVRSCTRSHSFGNNNVLICLESLFYLWAENIKMT